MKQAGQICAEALKSVLAEVKVGVSCAFLDQIAQKEIESRGASSSFKTVDDYKWTICTTINEQVVHGIPTDYKLKDGDILGIDIGAYFRGFHSDMAISSIDLSPSTSSRIPLSLNLSSIGSVSL